LNEIIRFAVDDWVCLHYTRMHEIFQMKSQQGTKRSYVRDRESLAFI